MPCKKSASELPAMFKALLPVKFPATPTIQKPSWKASVPTFIWLARKSMPNLKSCLLWM